MQPQGHMQVISNMVDFDMDPQAALDAGRFQVTAGNLTDLSKGVVVGQWVYMCTPLAWTGDCSARDAPAAPTPAPAAPLRLLLLYMYAQPYMYPAIPTLAPIGSDFEKTS